MKESDGGYDAEDVIQSVKDNSGCGKLSSEIDSSIGVKVLPRRWIVERTFALAVALSTLFA